MRAIVIVAVIALLQACATVAPVAHERPELNTILDDWHRAASVADEATYFDRFAPSGVFFGTDATERWTTEEFRTWAMPYFQRESAWTFTPRSRNVYISRDGSTAWFDEVLDSASYGECRGTGVLQKIAGEWRIEQYNLTIPIPNDLAKEFVARIREFQKNNEKKP